MISVFATLKHYSSRLKMYRFKQPKKQFLSIFERVEIIVSTLLYAVDTCVCVWLIVYAWYYIIRESYISRQKRIRWSASKRWQATTRETEDTNVESETSVRSSRVSSEAILIRREKRKKKREAPCRRKK